MKVLAIICALVMQQAVGDQNTDLVKSASNQFSNKLYQHLSEESGNLLVCPIGLHVILGLVHQGARGKTADELSTVLNLRGVKDGNIKEGYKSIVTNFPGNIVKIATKLYPANGYTLNRDYLGIAQQYFLSGVENIDYSDANIAANTINQYVEKQTNYKIKNLISPGSITPFTRFIMVNAIHFQATWRSPFQTVYDDNFIVSPGRKIKTKMMTQTDYFDYKEDPTLDAKVLKMDYAEGNYCMLFFLPNKQDGLAELESKLVEMNVERMRQGLRSTKVEVTIPKFKIEKKIELKPILEKMGLQDMFSNRADLSGIANGDKLYVSDVIQKTFINVNENGTEAAAATGGIIETLSAASSDEKKFIAKRPFYFCLITNNNNRNKPIMVLFGGRLVEPEGNQGGNVDFAESYDKNKEKNSQPQSNNPNKKPNTSNNNNYNQNIDGTEDGQLMNNGNPVNSNYPAYHEQTQKMGGPQTTPRTDPGTDDYAINNQPQFATTTSRPQGTVPPCVAYKMGTTTVYYPMPCELQSPNNKVPGQNLPNQQGQPLGGHPQSQSGRPSGGRPPSQPGQTSGPHQKHPTTDNYEYEYV